MSTLVSRPKVTVNKLPAQIAAGVESQKILVLGQKIGGTASAGALVEDVKKSQIDDLFGAGSICAVELNAAFKIIEDSRGDVAPRIDCISLEDNGVTKAAGTVIVSAVSGTEATAAGQAVFQIAGNEYKLDIIEGETIADIGAKLNTLLTDANAPFASAEVTNTVTLTSRNAGSVGNSTPIAVKGMTLSGSDYVIGNVKIAITAFTGGATDPVMTTVLDVVAEVRYQTIVAPVEYGTAYLLDDFLDTRFNVTNDILDGVAILTKVDTLANLKIDLAALNSQSCVYICDTLTDLGNDKGGSLKQMPYVVSMIVGTIRGLRLTEGSNILSITPASTYGAKDGRGGFEIRSLPYFNTPLNDIDVIDTGLGFSRIEVSEINEAGGTVIGNNVVNNGILLDEVRTTYKTDAAANEDTTWRFLNTVDEMSGSAEYIYRNLKKRFVQTRLTAGPLLVGRNMANEKSIKAYMKQLYKELGALAVAIPGKEAEDFFYENMIIEIDYTSGTVSLITNFPIVAQLREIIANLITQFGN